MGVSQLTAGKVAKGTLEIERCPVAGLVTTWSAGHLVTDSAAAATAMATGFKTGNGTLGIDPSGLHLKNIVEFAEENGKATGLVGTCAITHATPAGFAVHVPSRRQHNEIARQLAESDVDVLFGGGWKHFEDSMPQLKAAMTVVTNAAGFHALGTPPRAAALLYPVHPPYAAERSVSLKEMTRKAIEILRQDKDGFFLMVEGSQIDWAGHKNDATNIVSEVVDFDDAVGVGLDFAQQNGNTLILITSDHETGGFALLDGSIEKNKVTKTGFTTGAHSAAMTPFFACGPAAERFGGILDNTDIGKRIISLIQTAE